jgi:hypothetical protein
MKTFREFLLGRSDFKSADEIIALVGQSPFFEAQENIEQAEALLIFQTSRQQTWLVATNRRLYCILDDLNKGFTQVQWTIPKNELVDERGRIIVPMATGHKTDKTGLLDIGKRHNWLFSKRLFVDKDLLAKIQDMIVRRMTSV